MNSPPSVFLLKLLCPSQPRRVFIRFLVPMAKPYRWRERSIFFAHEPPPVFFRTSCRPRPPRLTTRLGYFPRSVFVFFLIPDELSARSPRFQLLSSLSLHHDAVLWGFQALQGYHVPHLCRMASDGFLLGRLTPSVCPHPPFFLVSFCPWLA